MYLVYLFPKMSELGFLGEVVSPYMGKQGREENQNLLRTCSRPDNSHTHDLI